MAQNLTKLQNGSDIRGIACEGIPDEEVNLNREIAGKIGGAFTEWLSQKVNKEASALRICIGSDPRISGDELKDGALSAVNSCGAQGYDAGLASTPAMFMSTVMPEFKFDGAIMTTASHLPFNRNGFKFFTAEGGLEKEDIAEILRLADKVEFKDGAYEHRSADVMPAYEEHLRQMISHALKDKPDCLKGMHIVVDAGNGAGGFFAKNVLEELGADISGSQFLEPDGMFPNHMPNPEDKAAMDSICKAVKDSNADLGIIFDTDVDRSAAVGPGGVPIARNEIVGLAAALAADEYPGGTVVTDSITSNELHDFLEKKLKLRHLRYKRGYRNVIGKAIELSRDGKKAFLAIETSGHAAYSDNYYLDDGAYLAVQIVINAARLKRKKKDITYLIKDLKAPAEAKEIRYKINAEDFGSYGSTVLVDFEKWAMETEGLEIVKPNYEGVRVDFKMNGCSGWFLLRKSLHDPVMPLNVESSDEGGLETAMSLIDEFIGRYPELQAASE